MRKNFQFYQWVILLWLGVGAQFTFASTIPEYNPICLVPPNECGPIAKFTSSVNSGNAPLSVQLNAGSSYDPDGSIASYIWVISTTQGQIGSLSGVAPSYIFRDAGSYTVKLTVADNSGNTDFAEKTIEVAPNNLSTNCNQVTEIPVTECQSLLELYNSTNGANWKNNTGWNQTNTPCSWFGVTCSGEHVQSLFLYSNQLSGSIPNFSNLPNLQSLSLTSNQLSGSIPNFSYLPNLQELNLYRNQLNGSIPNFSNLPNLSSLYLGENRLSGSIPNFNNLPNLQVLSLYKNQLNGSIPNFTNLPNLRDIFLNDNQLNGSIPNFINLPNSSRFSLSNNQLSGNIPNFTNLPNLRSLYLYSNQLGGNIPNFTNLLNLSILRLDNNQLSGKIPNFTSVNLTNLSTAKFNNNCGLVAYDAAQEAVLNQKDSLWNTRSPNCPVSNSYTLTLNKMGNGSISGSGTFTAGATVNLSAAPDAGWNFNGWSPTPCNYSFQMPANNLICTATFSQVTCNYSLSPISKSHSANAENGSFNVTVTGGCNWNANSNQSWVRITNPSGSGNATISYSVDANPSTTARSAIISVNGQTFTVNQSAKTVTQNPSIEISSNSLTFSQQVPTIDVMVLYTPTAASESANIISEIQAAIEQTNAAYRNSEINQRLNLVHTAQVNYQEQDKEQDNMRIDLDRLTATNDGFLDEIHALRDLHRADLVSLWRKNGNYCGIAWQLKLISPVLQSHAFSVIARSCANNLTFAHELGHNMGAHHDLYVAPENGLHNYSHGYIYLNQSNPNQSWRTIMSYDSEYQAQGISCTRIPYFSNPNVLYQNTPTGNSLANNATTLNESSTTVASYRGGKQSTKETQLLTISNKGSANLNVSNITTNNNSPWLSITPTSLSIAPNNSAQVQLTVDYSLIPFGSNSANVTIYSNDPVKSALKVTVNAQVTGQMDTMTVDSSKSNIFNVLKQELKLDVNVPNATRRSGIDSFRVSLKPVVLPEKPSSLVFELGDVQLLSGNVAGKNANYNAYSNTVDIPAVNVPDQKGMPQLFRAKLQWLSQHTNKSLFEVVDAGVIPMIAIE